MYMYSNISNNFPYKIHLSYIDSLIVNESFSECIIWIFPGTGEIKKLYKILNALGIRQKNSPPSLDKIFQY